MKYYETFEELKNCIGKVIYFYYTENGKKDGKIKYAWAKQITELKKNIRDNSIIDVMVYGINSVVFDEGKEKKIPKFSYKHEAISNAQQFARELTLNEKLIYRILIKQFEKKEKDLIKIKPQDDNKDS